MGESLACLCSRRPVCVCEHKSARAPMSNVLKSLLQSFLRYKKRLDFIVKYFVSFFLFTQLGTRRMNIYFDKQPYICV